MHRQRLRRAVIRLSTRKITLLLTFLSFSAITYIVAVSSSIPPPPRLSDPQRKPKSATERIGDSIDSISKSPLNPFKPATNAPPRQGSDEYGGSSWWTDWKWLSVPFSGDLTDDDRALLPPLKTRPPVYCYYDASSEVPVEEKEADAELLLTWRRAWWAQGFRPIILGPDQAKSNSAYEDVARIDVFEGLKTDLMRWLAWDSMGGGLLSEMTMIPMGASNDPLLKFLRGGDYPELTSWKGLGSGLLAGSEEAVNSAIRAVLESSEARSVLAALPNNVVKTDNARKPLAYYSPQTIARKYNSISEGFVGSRAASTRELTRLINGHLHSFWQSRFSHGIEIIRPSSNHTERLSTEAGYLAEALLTCPSTPLPSSCPPNRPKCNTCSTNSKKPRTSSSFVYHNSSRTYTLGVVPHPWTLTTLTILRDTFDIDKLRTEMLRNPWVSEITDDLVPDFTASDDRRVMRFKEAVASDFAEAHTLWLPAEDLLPMEELSYHFGFALPDLPRSSLGRVLPKPANPAEDPALEWILMERARHVVSEREENEDTRLRGELENWHRADYEAWKFTRAIQARRTMERISWSRPEEEKYTTPAIDRRSTTASQNKPG